MSARTTTLHGLMASVDKIAGGAVRALEQESNNLWPNATPTSENVIELVGRGFMPMYVGEQILRSEGIYLNITGGNSVPPAMGEAAAALMSSVWTAAFQAADAQPTEKEMLEIANRYFWADEKVKTVLQRYGYYYPTWKDQVTNLRYDIPGPADLVRFSVRHVWEPDLLQNIGYDQEFPGGVIDCWHAMKGLDYPLFTGPFTSQIEGCTANEGGVEALVAAYAEHGISEPTWAKAYWWSHWVLPSPGMGYEMLFRLRPDRDRSFDPPEALGADFSWEDLRLLLRANDYPPKYRPLLAAIAYRMPGVRFIRDFVKQKVYNYDNLLEWAKRWGYSPRDAKDIADDIWRNVQATEAKPSACKGCATCEAAFEVGVLTDGQLSECLTAYGASPEEAQRLASQAQLKLATQRAKEVVANIRRRYLKGSIAIGEARQLLSDYGLAPARVADYLDDWQIELEGGRKELSASQAVKYACQGIISLADLTNRLANLGYQPADAEALILEAELCAGNLATQAVAKADRAQRQREADAYRAQRRARQTMIEAQQLLAKHGSPAQLRKWFCEGAIGEPEVFSRLAYLGWPDEDISRLIGDCKSGMKPTRGQTQGTGGQGGTGGP